mgnify:CR=1 FL=1
MIINSIYVTNAPPKKTDGTVGFLPSKERLQ